MPPALRVKVKRVVRSNQLHADIQAAELVSQATQVNIQSADIQQALAETTEEAYKYGFLAGRRDGIKEGAELGRLVGELDGLIAGKLQGRAEGIEEGRKLEVQRDIDMGKQIEWHKAGAEGMYTGDIELEQRPVNDLPSSEQMDEEVMVNMPPPEQPLFESPPASPKALPEPEAQENKKPMNDPFQSLLGLVQRKKSG